VLAASFMPPSGVVMVAVLEAITEIFLNHMFSDGYFVPTSSLEWLMKL